VPKHGGGGTPRFSFNVPSEAVAVAGSYTEMEEQRKAEKRRLFKLKAAKSQSLPQAGMQLKEKIKSRFPFRKKKPAAGAGTLASPQTPDTPRRPLMPMRTPPPTPKQTLPMPLRTPPPTPKQAAAALKASPAKRLV
jgi:hypothetical protein